MDKVPVESSNIKSIGYDPKDAILEIEFNSGGVYQYFGVPNAIYVGIIGADSHGKFFHQFVKGVYQYSRIR